MKNGRTYVSQSLPQSAIGNKLNAHPSHTITHSHDRFASEMLNMIGTGKQSNPLQAEMGMLKTPSPLFNSPMVQAKLAIGGSNDKFEQEADAMADHLVGKGEAPAMGVSAAPPIQRSGAGNVTAPPALGGQLESTRQAGSPLEPGIQKEMEAGFGKSFGDVRIHTGKPSTQMNEDLNAHAFTHGKNIYFNEGMYEPKSQAGKRLLAHELTHVVQQGGSEWIQRYAKTFGGEFKVPTYQKYTGTTPNPAGGPVLNMVGATIDLQFFANEHIEAKQIGLTQSVKTMRNNAPGGAINTPSYVSQTNMDLGLTTGNIGSAIDILDKVPSTTLPNNNPLYGAFNSQVPNPDPKKPGKTIDTVSANLGDTPLVGINKIGSKVKGSKAIPARLTDEPKRPIMFPGQEYEQEFEVAAIAMDGDYEGMYLGSVKWGWKSNAAGIPTLDPPFVEVVSGAVPSDDFKDTAEVWNDAEFTDSATNKKYDSVDLPIPDSGARKGQDQLTMPEVLKRLVAIDDRLAKNPCEEEKKYLDLEKKAILATIKKRKVVVDLKIIDQEDWWDDEPMIEFFKGDSLIHTSGHSELKEGRGRKFFLMADKLWPLSATDSLKLKVWDWDSPDRNDLITEIDWKYPFEPTQNGSSLEGTNYEVKVKFGR